MPTPAQRLALLMEAHDDSFRSAAERCGLDHTTLMRVKGGETENPATLAKIAEGYEVPVMWMRGEPDLATDFMIGVLSRPLQERVMLLWERDRRAPYALSFLHNYDSKQYTWPWLAQVLEQPESDVERMVKCGHGQVGMAKLERLCTQTGLPIHWFESGLVGREDEEEILVGLAELVLTHLAEEEGVEVTKDEIHEAAVALI